MNFPRLSDAERVRLLEPPSGKVSIALDTDTYNEIDDQFAVVYSLLSPASMKVEAIYAAPFKNNRSKGAGDGMEKSYEEILRLLSRLDVSPKGFVYKGSDRFLEAADKPVESDAARDIVKRAMEKRDGPLYVVPIGAITNVASAILMEPEIIKRIVVVWLGGQPYDWPTAREFNLQQDPHASRLIFDCGVPLVHIPCQQVAAHLRTTGPEMAHFVKGRGDIGDYLYEIFMDYVPKRGAKSKVIWDISCVAWLINYRWIPSRLTHSPILTRDLTYSRNPTRHLVRVATMADRDAVFTDLFNKLAESAK